MTYVGIFGIVHMYMHMILQEKRKQSKVNAKYKLTSTELTSELLSFTVLLLYHALAKYLVAATNSAPII